MQIDDPIWFKAPSDIIETEATCLICHEPVQPGELIAEDGQGYLHESCLVEEIEDGQGV
jgi:hypothetical protein